MTEQSNDVPLTISGSPKTVSNPSGKSYKWEARCGEVLPTQRAMKAHQKECVACLAKKKKYHWLAKCGAEQRTKRDIHAHQKQCPICMSMIHTGPSSGKERVMYCGEKIRTREKASAHFQACEQCQMIRQEIRVQTCKDLEHTPEMRKKYSETAKITSARLDIQQQRAVALKKWREDNPEAFSAIRSKAHASPKLSKMEMWLEPHLIPLGFVRNTQLRCGEERKQIDFIHREKQIIIEVDGPWHFLPIQTEDYLKAVQARDQLLNQEIMNRSWRLIRLSMQCFKGSSGKLISPELNQLIATINDGSWTGIRCYGSLYEQRSWAGIKVTILK